MLLEDTDDTWNNYVIKSDKESLEKHTAERKHHIK